MSAYNSTDIYDYASVERKFFDREKVNFFLR